MCTYLSYLGNCQVLKILKTKSWTYTIDFKSFLYIRRYFGQIGVHEHELVIVVTWIDFETQVPLHLRLGCYGPTGLETQLGCWTRIPARVLGSTVVVIFAYIPWMFSNMSRMGMTTVVFLCWCLVLEGFFRTHLKLKRQVRVSHA